MINLARWLRHLPRRKSARRSPGQVGIVGRPVPADSKIRRLYEDKMMRSQRDYDTREATNG